MKIISLCLLKKFGVGNRVKKKNPYKEKFDI